MNINQRLSSNYKSVVADLFLSALGEKFIPILGDKKKAKKLLEKSINEENCFAAESNNKLLGILAFSIKNKNFISLNLKNIVSVYGLFSGLLKTIFLSFLEHNPPDNEIYIEAVAVNESARGKGVGTQLFDMLFAFARENSYKSISLQVIDTNPKALELYKRLGFEIVKL